jgi:hypothetical protein
MSNHVHLLIHINTSSLSLVMKNINYRYARWMNRKENRIGHLFQGRYRSLEVSNDMYLVNLCRYIHHNPIEAKMVSNLGEYRWSSHQNYMENNFPSWMDSELMLSVIKNITNLSYIDFINKSTSREKWKPALYISETGEFLHNEDMLIMLQKKNFQQKNSIGDFLSEDEVISIVCGELNILQSEIMGPSKSPGVAKQRILLARYLMQYSNKNIMHLSKMFFRSHGTISRQLKKMESCLDSYFSQVLLKKIEFRLQERFAEK